MDNRLFFGSYQLLIWHLFFYHKNDHTKGMVRMSNPQGKMYSKFQDISALLSRIGEK